MPEGNQIDVAELRRMLDEGDVTLVDVREPFEWEAGRIPGAHHIQLAELSARADEIDRDRPVVFQCHVGNRSAMATEAFRSAGFEAFNLAGGIEAWEEAGLELDPPDGKVVSR